MHLRFFASVPLPLKRSFNLSCQLKQQAIVCLLSQRMNPKRQSIFLACHGE